MKRLMAWGLWLYPHRWQHRYGREFLALIDDSRPRAADFWDVLKGAMLMQLTSGSMPKIIAGFTVAGLIAAGTWILFQPHRYISTSVLRLSADETPMERIHRLQRAQQFALSRTSLAQIIQRENLYPDARREQPIEHIIQSMRNKDVLIRPRGTNVEVSVAYPDPAGAQKATRSIVAALNQEEPTLRPLDTASAARLEDTRPIKPLLGGLLAGLGAGILCAAAWSFKRVTAFALAGMLAGGIVALLIPNQYISTAILRVADESKLPSAIQRANEPAALNRLAAEYSLYPGEANPGARMHSHLEIREVRPVGGPFRPAAITLSFRHTDRYKAEAVTRAMTSQLLLLTDTGFEILDPASYPQAPSSPNRPQILALGLFAGVLLGLMSTRFYRPAAVAAAALLAVTVLHAQPRPTFEVASIKRNPDCGNRRGGGPTPAPGRFSMACQTTAGLIQAAYVAFADGAKINMKIPDITGLPDWAQYDTYDINATAADRAPVAKMWGPMLQALLEERFHLKLHHDTKEISVYLLTVAKGGLKLEPTKEGSCMVLDPDHLPQPPKPGEPRPNICGMQNMTRKGATIVYTGRGLTMETLAGGPLARTLGRPILDRTGIPGMFEIEIEFAANDGPEAAGLPLAGVLQKVGLKLDAGKGPTDTIVIDHIERPTEN